MAVLYRITEKESEGEKMREKGRGREAIIATAKSSQDDLPVGHESLITQI